MTYASEQSVLNGQWNAAELACQAEAERMRPCVLFRPAIYIDGNKWCALYGENLQDGVAGFGDSPAEAMADFDKAWVAKLGPRVAAARNALSASQSSHTQPTGK